MTKEEALKKYFGYDRFYPLQAEIIDHVRAGKSALVLMPTGGGKSVCFQIPAVMARGVTVVISPLIALMKDQVDGLQANGISAAFLNSTQTEEESRDVYRRCLAGDVKLLYLSPERLSAPGTAGFLRKLDLTLFAVDEAHCISSWGHDFRPDYLKLSLLREQFPSVPLLALTATADRVIRRDILRQLAIPEPHAFIASFDRPNLSLAVYSGQKRLEQILRFLAKRKQQPGIIYCLSRKTTENVASRLTARGFRAAHYHAGMENDERSKVQEAFIRDKLQIICATIAFGLGIDKSNIRWIVHYSLPKNIESYYQEIGRAGRDGAPADTVLFYSYADVKTHHDMIRDAAPERQDLLLAKLDRMKRYAEADICRRRMLLSYFNEEPRGDCGNCDVCKNPPQKFDGTVIAQKALSAVYRTGENITMSTLIQILRGSHSASLRESGYDRIRTFGAGRDIPYGEWAEYIFQLLNMGCVDIAYDEGSALKLNDLSRKILKAETTVMLTRPAEMEKKLDTIAAPARAKTPGADGLFERLRALRRELADKLNVPAYVVFSDRTLLEMAEARPRDEADLLGVSGVGEHKLARYGKAFLDAIRRHGKEES
ncbi:MAG: DNA helicase RecQ [Deltaproteobacteria bacterium]|nr:DNA helicase RecQ [Deltaproteobacteria bacterium]